MSFFTSFSKISLKFLFLAKFQPNFLTVKILSEKLGPNWAQTPQGVQQSNLLQKLFPFIDGYDVHLGRNKGRRRRRRRSRRIRRRRRRIRIRRRRRIRIMRRIRRRWG
jgi:hypothetical protein